MSYCRADGGVLTCRCSRCTADRCSRCTADQSPCQYAPPVVVWQSRLSLQPLLVINLWAAFLQKSANCSLPTKIDNKFTGNLPTKIGELHNLREIIVSTNLLSGALPPSLGKLQQLGKLDLGNNQLSGELLAEIGFCKQLGEIDLSKNQIFGSIPANLGTLSVLNYLDLSDNLLIGSFLPSSGI
jgi:hypothetical protein